MGNLSLIVINHHLCTTPAAIFLFFSTIAIVALCAKHGFVPKKSQSEASNQTSSPRSSSSPLESPRKLAKNIGVKAIPQCIRSNQQENVNNESCIWKKDILMGEKCQPLQFSGAIYYDSEGNMLSAPPARSPRIAGSTNSPNLPAISGLEVNRDVKIDVN